MQTDTLKHTNSFLINAPKQKQNIQTVQQGNNNDTLQTDTNRSAKKFMIPQKLESTKTAWFDTINFATEGYFKNSKYFKPSHKKGYSGVEGKPIPYNMSNDNTVTGSLLICFAIGMIAASMSKDFILQQIKSLLHLPHRKSQFGETPNEVRFQIFLIVQTALLFSITYYLYNKEFNASNYIIDNQLIVVGIYLCIFLLYFLIKYLLYTAVNWVYFHKKQNTIWTHFRLFITSLEGVLVFPGVLLLIYFDLSPQYALFYIASVVFLTKILTFYQAFIVFFKKTTVSLQIILYFCTLELMPLISLLGLLTYTGNYLTINY